MLGSSVAGRAFCQLTLVDRPLLVLTAAASGDEHLSGIVDRRANDHALQALRPMWSGRSTGATSSPRVAAITRVDRPHGESWDKARHPASRRTGQADIGAAASVDRMQIGGRARRFTHNCESSPAPRTNAIRRTSQI